MSLGCRRAPEVRHQLIWPPAPRSERRAQGALRHVWGQQGGRTGTDQERSLPEGGGGKRGHGGRDQDPWWGVLRCTRSVKSMDAGARTCGSLALPLAATQRLCWSVKHAGSSRDARGAAVEAAGALATQPRSRLTQANGKRPVAGGGSGETGRRGTGAPGTPWVVLRLEQVETGKEQASHTLVNLSVELAASRTRVEELEAALDNLA